MGEPTEWDCLQNLQSLVQNENMGPLVQEGTSVKHRLLTMKLSPVMNDSSPSRQGISYSLLDRSTRWGRGRFSNPDFSQSKRKMQDIPVRLLKTNEFS